MVVTGCTSQLCGPQQKRIRFTGPGIGCIPHRKLSRTISHTRKSPVHKRFTLQIASNVARGTLPGGRKTSRPTTRPRRQISSSEKVSSASHNLGWWTKDSLFQRTNTISIAGMVSTRSISESNKKTWTCSSDWLDANTRWIQKKSKIDQFKINNFFNLSPSTK